MSVGFPSPRCAHPRRFEAAYTGQDQSRSYTRGVRDIEVIEGRFALERRVASGGMGEVYRGIDRQRDTVVAIKLLHSEAAVDIHRFHREAGLLSRLSHRKIVGYVAHGAMASGRPYLVEDWVEGETLASKLRGEGIDVRESVEVARQVADALAVAHGAGIVHRDIKPENLMLEYGRCDAVKVVDFGIARPAEPSVRLTSTGVIIGTFGYMAPEQARGSGAVDVRADVFALGCVLYECLTGVAAFGGQNGMAIRAKILLTEPEPLHQRRPDLPPSLCRLVTDMLAKDPAGRPADAQVVAEALAALGPLPTSSRCTVGAASPATATYVPGVQYLPHGETNGETDVEISCLVLATVESEEDPAAPAIALVGATFERAELARSLELHPDQIERLGDDALIIQIVGPAGARRQAERAAQVALALQSLAPETCIAIAAEPLDDSHDRGPTLAIDTGTSILDAAAQRAAFANVDALRDLFDRHDGRAKGPGIALDPLCAALLSHRFIVERTEQGFTLHAEPQGAAVRE